MNYEDILKLLEHNKDIKYKIFNDKIVNTKMNTIGVRVPVLRKISKKIAKTDYEAFLNQVKNNYYEEVMLEGMVISNIKDPSIIIQKLDKFLDKIDNWAICDMVCSSCKILNKIKDEFMNFIKRNLLSSNPWRVRFSFVSLLNYFVSEEYLNEIYKLIDNDVNHDYYVMMSKAWLICECYVKYPKKTIKYLKHSNIDLVTYNKAISKIIESNRVLKNDKIELKKMKKSSKNA